MELTDLMSKILNIDPELRVDVKTIISHPWITKYGNNAQEYSQSQDKQKQLNQPSLIDNDIINKLHKYKHVNIESVKDSVLNNRLD